MVSYPRRPKSGHFTRYLNRTYHVLPTTRLRELDREAAHAYGSFAENNFFAFDSLATRLS